MATMQQGSLFFSLKHPSSSEKKYSQNEETERALGEARRSCIDAALARTRADAERKARVDAERRAERLQAESAYVVAIERVRAEAEMAARIEASRIALDHERALASINADVQKKRLAQAVRVGIIGPATHSVVCKYGQSDVAGSGSNQLALPGGFDMLAADGSTPLHAGTG